MHTLVYILAVVAVVGAITSTLAALPMMQAQNDTGNETITTEEPGVITFEGNETGPIVVENQTTEEPAANETTTTEQPVPGEPEVLTEPGTEGPFNITAEQTQEEATISVSLASLTAGNNVTVIEPDGNVTVVPDANVTIVDNDTVVIAPPAENVTTLPENNVTVITPAPEPCDCPVPGVPEEKPLAPVIVRPAPGQEVTIEGGTVTVENDTGVVVEGTGNTTGVSTVQQTLSWWQI